MRVQEKSCRTYSQLRRGCARLRAEPSGTATSGGAFVPLSRRCATHRARAKPALLTLMRKSCWTERRVKISFIVARPRATRPVCGRCSSQSSNSQSEANSAPQLSQYHSVARFIVPQSAHLSGLSAVDSKGTEILAEGLSGSAGSSSWPSS